MDKLFLFSVCLLCAAFVPLSAQSYPQWGNLKAGPYSVGFREVYTYDYSRNYRPKVDHNGKPVVGETARPMRISLWYPGTHTKRARPLLYREYVFQRETELRERTVTLVQQAQTIKEFADFIRPFQSWNDGKLVKLFPDDLPEERVRRMMTTPTAAFRNAIPVKGSFPVLLFLGSAETDSVLFEYLASQGYIVAGIPDIGTSPAYYRLDYPDRASRELSKANDLAFLRGYIRTLPGADNSKVGAIGIGGAGNYPPLLLQSKTAPLNLLITGADASELTRDEIARLRIPLLSIGSGDLLTMNPDAAGKIERSIQSLQYADRYLVRLNRVGHPDLSCLRRAAYPEKAGEDQAYEVMATYILNFLNANFKHDSGATSFLRRAPEANGLESGYVTAQFTAALPPVPTEEEFLTLLREQPDITEVRHIVSDVKLRQPNYTILSERAVSILIQILQQRGNDKESIEVLKWVLEAYPESIVAHSTIGDAYAETKQKDLAVRHYETGLELLAKNSTLAPPQKERTQKSLQQKLVRLKQEN